MTARKLCAWAGGIALVSLALATAIFWEDVWPGIRGWWRLRTNFEPIATNSQGYPEYRHRKTGLVFVRVPGGSFVMGASRDELRSQLLHRDPIPGIAPPSEESLDGWEENEKQHRVILSPFLIAKYEVTQEAWRELMGNLPHLIADTNCSMGPRFPVELITREEAQRFCDRYGFALPSEAQWEYACRGGSTAAFSGTGVPDDMAWHRKNSGDKSHPVGTKQPNGFGLHDMHGNVAEFCLDIFAPFYGLPEAEGPDPVCTSGGLGTFVTFVKRGGSYAQFAFNCRSASRSNEGPSNQGSAYTGVRPVFLLR